MKRAGILLTLSAIIAFGACGKKDETPPPPPPPQVANPVPTGPIAPFNPGASGTIQGTSCAMPPGGEIAVRRDGSPFYGQLSTPGYGGSSNSIILGAAFTRSNSDMFIQNVVAGALMVYPDAVMMLPQGASATNFNVCVSSVVPGVNAPSAGTFNMQDLSVSISMTGMVAVPYYSPFGGYPTGTVPTGQEVMRVNLGQTCPAYLYQGRVIGCVDIQLGNGNMPPRHYESR